MATVKPKASVQHCWAGNCNGREFKNQGALTIHMRHRHPEISSAPAAPPVAGAEGNGSIDDTRELPILDGYEAERRPEGPPEPPSFDEKARSVFGRLKGAASPKPADTPAEGPPEIKPALPKHRRVSTQDLWADAVGGIATPVAKAGFVPMSRAMLWSTPVAGEIIEDATRGTIVDKIIQPIARNGEKWQDLFDLVGLWAAIGVAQAQPEKAPLALDFARKRLTNLLPKVAANVVKQRKKERDAAAALAELMPELRDLGLGDDPIGGLLEMLFAPPGPLDAQPAPKPAPAPAAAASSSAA